MKIIQRIGAAPLTSLLIAVAIFATVRAVASLTAERPLAERPGFDEAMSALASLDPTTFVVVAPPEQTEALDHVPAHLAASDAVHAREALLTRWSSFVAVGPRGITLQGLGAEVERRAFGEVDLVRYDNPSGERVIFDLARDLDQVTVTLEGETTVTCNQREADGLHCPGRPSWNHVGPARLTVSGSAWPATWAHPVTGHDLKIALPELPLSEAIVLEAALDDGVARNGAPVELELQVGPMVRKYVRSAASGVLAARFPTTPGSFAPVVLTIRTAQDGQRHLGVRLRITTRRP
ncbi:MAG: hypothetical protein ACAI38_14990 [Myxococcota bacterium]|nr:hypothetical protein [Myxococcota bacterium]